MQVYLRLRKSAFLCGKRSRIPAPASSFFRKAYTPDFTFGSSALRGFFFFCARSWIRFPAVRCGLESVGGRRELPKTERPQQPFCVLDSRPTAQGRFVVFWVKLSRRHVRLRDGFSWTRKPELGFWLFCASGFTCCAGRCWSRAVWVWGCI